MTLLLRLWWGLVRTFFRLLYGPFAWAYDGVAWLVSLGQWTAWGRVPMRYLQGPRLLELGHGPGHLLVTMAQKGLATVGIDLSPQMGQLAGRRLRRAGLAARLVRARAQTLPFRDRAFSGVTATFPTEFILDPRTVQEVTRVLSPGGNVAIVASARLTNRDPLSAFIEWLYRVTGQREPLPGTNDTVWKKSGLALCFEWVPVGRSRVLVAVGHPQVSSSSFQASAGPEA